MDTLIVSEYGLNSRIESVTGVDMHHLVQELRESTIKYQRQKAEVEYLEDMRKVVLAEIMEDERDEITSKGEKVTESRLDNLARRSQRYQRFIQDQRASKNVLAELEAEYYALRNKLEVIQAQLHFARSEMYLER